MATNAVKIAYLSLAEAATNRNLKRETLRLWIVRGVRLPNKPKPLRLKADWVGGRWLTTDEWVQEFIDLCTQSRTNSTSDLWAAEREAAQAKLAGA